MFPKKLAHKIQKRQLDGSIRALSTSAFEYDFCSNDYLGFAKNKTLQENICNANNNFNQLNGSTGSRLISGNNVYIENLENFVAEYHNAEASLIFNSGYDANIGLISALSQKNDLILYDNLVHASIIDGIKLSHATAYKFNHLDISDLAKKLSKFQSQFYTIYVVTESVFSMDGDSPDLTKLVETCQNHKAFLIVDEAHALGLFPHGMAQEMSLENQVFARIFTYGKALGVHGAAVVGSKELKNYLINFSRSFIYTTAPNHHQISSINQAYKMLIESKELTEKLKQKISFFKSKLKEYNIHKFIPSDSSIQCVVFNDILKTKQIASNLQQKGFGVKAILSPTVPIGQERLRICLHSFNTDEEIIDLIKNINELID